MSAAFLPPLPCAGPTSHQAARADHCGFTTYLRGAGGGTWVLEECGEGESIMFHGAEEKWSVPQPQSRLEPYV